MANRRKPLHELEKCPICKYDEFYVNVIMLGRGAYFYQLGTYNGDGYLSGDNTDLHDGLEYRHQKKAYCGNCHNYLGKYEDE